MLEFGHIFIKLQREKFGMPAPIDRFKSLPFGVKIGLAYIVPL